MEIIWAVAFVLLCFMCGHSERTAVFVRRAVLVLSVVGALAVAITITLMMEEWATSQVYDVVAIFSLVGVGLLCCGLYFALDWILLWVVRTVGNLAESVVKAFKSI